MRITPLAIYGLYISDIELKTYVNEECDLTHPNPIIKDAAYIYCIAIKYLLLNKNRKDVYNMCIDLIKTPRLKIVLNDSNNRAEPIYLLTKDSNDKYVNTDDKQYQGYVGIALQNAFYELLNGNTFYESMLNIIRRGGDVDTNCSIAGGLLGAFYGYKNIEPDWIKLIKNTDRGVEFISPSQTDTYIEKLYKVIQPQ
jgi:ADP-ribosylglycohydrolase